MTKKANKQQTKQTDRQTIVQHVKTSENKLNDVLANISKQVEAKEVTRNTHAYKTRQAYRKSTKAKQSRRAIIIDLFHTEKLTALQINDILVKQHDIADKANNLKSISGTRSDLNSNSTCFIKKDAESKFYCVSENCKHKK